jgi:hypothetical protein
LEQQQQVLEVDELTQDHAMDHAMDHALDDKWVVDDPRSRSRSRELRALLE